MERGRAVDQRVHSLDHFNRKFRRGPALLHHRMAVSVRLYLCNVKLETLIRAVKEAGYGAKLAEEETL